jgi:hypothetical protein
MDSAHDHASPRPRRPAARGVERAPTAVRRVPRPGPPMPRPRSQEVVVYVQARLYGPAHAALDAARRVAEDAGGFVTRAERLGGQLLAVEIELLAGSLPRLPAALDGAGLKHDLTANDLPADPDPDADARCRLAIQIVNDDPDGTWRVPSVPG